MIFSHEHKVAIATQDGQEIAQHFGLAPIFLIYTLREGRVIDIEMRSKSSNYVSGERDEGCRQVIEELLPDVRVVISHGMGENAYVGLLRRDVLPLNTDERDAEKAIQAYIRDSLKDNPELVHEPRRRGPIKRVSER